MPEILDIIDLTGDPEEQLTSTRKNFATLSKQALKSGTFLLLDIIGPSILINVTSTTYVNVPSMSGSFNSSGGLVYIDCVIPVSTIANQINLAIFIDDVENGDAVLYSSTQVSLNLNLSRWIQLNAGNHKIQIKYKVNTGSVSVFNVSAKSTLSIIEFLRG